MNLMLRNIAFKKYFSRFKDLNNVKEQSFQF
jgi:hypothetical protein